jgi:signal peptidase I
MRPKIRIAKKIVDAIATVVLIVALMVCVYLLSAIFLCSTYIIPSESMSWALLPGDQIWVEKLTLGARLFKDSKLNKDEKIPYRLPGLSQLRRGDVIVFNFPYKHLWDSIAMSEVFYVKRCMALPGDTIAIRDFEYRVNNIPSKYQTSAASLRRNFPPDTVMIRLGGAYVLSRIDSTIWTIRNYGPLYVPRCGDSILLSQENINLYKTLIEWECRQSNQPIDIEHGKKYTFKHNYYFVTGDNTAHSTDSRYWGLLPEDFIVGRAFMILWSYDKDGFKWDRIFRRIE